MGIVNHRNIDSPYRFYFIMKCINLFFVCVCVWVRWSEVQYIKCLCFRGKKKNSDCMNLDGRYCVNGCLIFEQVCRITSTIHMYLWYVVWIKVSECDQKEMPYVFYTAGNIAESCSVQRRSGVLYNLWYW